MEKTSLVKFADGLQYEFTHDEESDTYTIQNVEVFETGKWNGEPYTLEDVQAIVVADEELHDLVRPRIKVGHTKEDLEGTDKPAFGWLGALKLKGQKILADFKRIPKGLFDAIQKGQYARQSVELLIGYEHPETRKRYPMVLDAVAFLGADLPAVPTLKPIAAFHESGELIRLFHDVDASKDGAPDEPSIRPKANGEGDAERRSLAMSDELKAREEALALERKAFKAEKEAHEAAETALEAERKEVEESRVRVHASKVDGMWHRILDTGHAKPAEERSFSNIGMDLDDTTKREFADHEGNKIQGTRLDEHFSSWMSRPEIGKDTAGKPAGKTREDDDDAAPKGLAGWSGVSAERMKEADVKLFQAAEELARKRKLDPNDPAVLEEAMIEIEQTRPELVTEYRKQFSTDQSAPVRVRREG